MIDPHLASGDVRLQILLAKVSLSAEERVAAASLARQVEDWDALLETAARNFSLPMMRLHLGQMPAEVVPEDVLSRLNEAANASAIRNIQLISAQAEFVEKCLQPLGIDGIFFKGVNIAQQFYPDLGLRPCRDIDILLPPGSIRAVTMKAIDLGYEFVIPRRSGKPLKTKDEFEAALYYRGDANLISPGGAAIDLQEKLDKHSGIFSGLDVFAQAVPMSVGGRKFLTMPPALLFNYICHHHARHTWSHLHWLSDIDAMVNSPTFDRADVLSLADQLGQRGTVEASLEMQQLMSPLASWDRTPETKRGLQFLELCLLNLPGRLDLEKRIAIKMTGGEFMFDWQANPELIRRARWRQMLHIFKPTVQQYDRFPLPRGLRWVYVVPRLVDVLYQARVRTRKRPR